MKNSAKKIISVALLLATTSSFAGTISNATSQNRAIAEQIKALNLRFEANNKIIMDSKPKLESAIQEHAKIKAALAIELSRLAEMKKQYEYTYMKLKSSITPGTTASTSPTISNDITRNPNLMAIKKNIDLAQMRVTELTNSVNKLGGYINSLN